LLLDDNNVLELFFNILDTSILLLIIVEVPDVLLKHYNLLFIVVILVLF
jgi:hypothetical protein